MAGGLSTLAAAKIAELCWDTLFQYGEAALLAVKQKLLLQQLKRNRGKHLT